LFEYTFQYIKNEKIKTFTIKVKIKFGENNKFFCLKNDLF